MLSKCSVIWVARGASPVQTSKETSKETRTGQGRSKRMRAMKLGDNLHTGRGNRYASIVLKPASLISSMRQAWTPLLATLSRKLLHAEAFHTQTTAAHARSVLIMPRRAPNSANRHRTVALSEWVVASHADVNRGQRIPFTGPPDAKVASQCMSASLIWPWASTTSFGWLSAA